MKEEYSFEELKIISHCLGLDFFRLLMSKKKREKVLPISFYRNYYQAKKNYILDGLVERGLAVNAKRIDLNYYHITEDGIQKFRNQMEDLIKYTPEKDRNLEYLKRQINLYCQFYNYNFCQDNSEHIIDAYINYFSKKYYVSHTTKDVIMQFKSELKKLLKEPTLNPTTND
jgi:hypothetical protein